MNNFLSWFKSPTFENDADKTMVAQLLTPILLTIFFVPLGLVIPFVALKLEIAERFGLLTLFSVALSSGLFFLVKRGQIYNASRGLVLGLWIAMTVASWTGGGTRAPAFVGYLVIILLTGLLLREYWGIGITLLCSFSGWGMVYAESQGWLIPLSPTPSSLSVLLVDTVFFAVAILLQMFASRTTRHALNRARQEITERRRAEQSLRESEQQLQTSLAEKELLLKEVHHRVKNNMQVIVSMLNLQAAHLNDGGIVDAMRESQNRVRSMALVHEKLYQSKNLSQIDFREYLQHLASTLFHSFSPDTSQIDLKFDIGEILLGVDTAIPCGLIVNELLSNALKHAFPNNHPGTITIGLQKAADGLFELRVSDNGVGFPEGKNWQETESLGMQLVLSLVKQINGTIDMLRLQPGACFIIRFNQTTGK